MNNMFNNCANLKQLNLKSFDTSSVLNMGMMFYGCQSITSLDLTNFRTKQVANMGGMFGKCLKLETVDMRNFESFGIKINANLFNEVTDTGTIYYNKELFNKNLLEYKTINNWNKIDVSSN